MRAQLAIVVALAFVVAACGGSGPAAPAAASPAPPASAETAGERMTRLYEAAKAEGKIAFYSSMNTDDARTIIPKFEQRFPGLKIEHTRVTGEQLVTRVITEVRAGQNLFDIFDSSSFQVKQIVDLGYTQPYMPSASEDIPPEGRDAKGTWIANRGVPLAIGFNTQKGVKVGDIKGWADLCDKKYESKIAVEVGDVVVYSALKKQLGEAEAQRILKCVAANKPILRSGHTEIDSLLPAGEFAVTFASHSYRLAAFKYEQNKAVDWVKDVIVMDLAGMTLAAKAPHPNAARLFTEWLVSQEGQETLATTGRPPASTKVKMKYPDVLGDKRIYVTLDLMQTFDKDSEFWNTTLGIK